MNNEPALKYQIGILMIRRPVFYGRIRSKLCKMAKAAVMQPPVDIFQSDLGCTQQAFLLSYH